MSGFRKYGTCFFERYAKISLESLLGEEYSGLVNRDRPDLQTPDDKSVGIEVTRAMEENKTAADTLLKEIAGIIPSAVEKDIEKVSGQEPDEAAPGDDMENIIRYGYAYGLRDGKYVGSREAGYWAMAHPLRRILESKISKAGNGFYGRFDKMGLYVFCKNPMKESEAAKTCRYAISLQKNNDIRYDCLYLSEVSGLYVCDLRDGMPEKARLSRHPISKEQRKEYYLEAVRSQFEDGTAL